MIKAAPTSHYDALASSCTDMWEAYVVAVEEVLPHAAIVIDRIANYFRARQTSGFVEGLNNKLKVLQAN